MVFVLPEREQEIAELLAGYRSSNSDPQSQLFFDTFRATFADTYSAFFADVDAGRNQPGSGQTLVFDTWALIHAQAAGTITRGEVEGTLSEKYPDYDWTDGVFGIDQNDNAAAQDAIEAINKPSEDPDAQAFPTQIGGNQTARGGDLFVGGSGGGGSAETSIYVDELPSEYDQTEVQSVVQNIADQAALGMAQLANGNIRFQPNTIDGGAIIPGSVTPPKLNQTAVAAFARQLPGEDQVVTLDLTKSRFVDQYAAADTIDAGTFGPSRVYEVARVSLPAGVKLRPGPIRYRVVTKGLRMGLMSVNVGGGVTIATGADVAELAAVTYGCIIRNIPSFIGLGKIPTHMEAVSVGYPTGQCFKFEDTIGALFEQEYTDDVFKDDPPRMYVPFNEPGPPNVMVPTNDYADTIEGMSFMAITGRTERQVFTQLNSQATSAGDYITGNGGGVTASLPKGLPHVSPFPAQLSYSQSSGLPFNIQSVKRNEAAATNEPAFGLSNPGVGLGWVRGAPMVHEDCGKLIATETHFSLAIQLYPSYQLTLSQLTGAGSSVTGALNNWGRIGIEIADIGRRLTAIDIIVA